MRRFFLFLFVMVFGIVPGIVLTGSIAAAAPQKIVAELTIFSDVKALGNLGSIGVFSGHAFITVKNVSGSQISVGGMSKIAPQETISVGTWGNKKEHAGVWYNLESYFVHLDSSAFATASLTRSLTAADLRTLNTYILRHDSYDTLLALNNCSTFASGAWNSVTPWSSELYAGGPNTPTGLFYSITQVGAVKYGEASNIPWNSIGVWHADGKKKPVRSVSFADAAPNITFDEFPVGTVVTNQYAGKGALFSGSPGPVISQDVSNPTAPVLSPGAGYSGTIDITFVSKGRNVASAIAFDIGYINDWSGASISWYSSRDKLIGQTSTNDYGIVRILIDNIGVHRIHIDTTKDTAGAAIDNLEFDLK